MTGQDLSISLQAVTSSFTALTDFLNIVFSVLSKLTSITFSIPVFQLLLESYVHSLTPYSPFNIAAQGNTFFLSFK